MSPIAVVESTGVAPSSTTRRRVVQGVVAATVLLSLAHPVVMVDGCCSVVIQGVVIIIAIAVLLLLMAVLLQVHVAWPSPQASLLAGNYWAWEALYLLHMTHDDKQTPASVTPPRVLVQLGRRKGVHDLANVKSLVT
ncbi:hypothetical protein EDB89DRAFT_1907718 [Lactarius sanguifluus]|nr:hypothetical protein EDB89DRAFT_1907718 [Lactarius sanguifluus]